MKRTISSIFLCLLLAACSTATQVTPVPPTNTPIPPTNTPILPTSMPTGTIVLEGGGISIQLPDTYFGGSNENLDEVLQKLEDMGSDYENAANVLKENHDDYILFAYDSRIGSATNITNLLIGKLSLAEDITLESQVQDLFKSYEEAGGTDIQSKSCQYKDYECLEFQVTLATDRYNSKALQYLIKKGEDVYMLTFTTSIEEFDERYDEFSQAFNSFKVLE